MTPRRFAIRFGGLAVLALAIGGPTPGYVGNCDPSGSGGSVDRVQFCTDKSTYACARDRLFGRTTQEQYNTCQMQIDSMCHGFNFPSGCSPTRQLADACINAVSDANRIATPTDALPECMSSTLCGAAPLEGI